MDSTTTTTRSYCYSPSLLLSSQQGPPILPRPPRAPPSSGGRGGGNDNRRRGGYQQLKGNTIVDTTSNHPYRPHAITLFPGDYSDDGVSLWDSDLDFGDNNEESFEDDNSALVEYWRKQDEQTAALREKWKQNARPPIRTSQIDPLTASSYGRGGRKTASARVWITPGQGAVVIQNHGTCLSLEQYFDRYTDRELVLAPLVATDTCGLFDVHAMVQGSGLTGQAGAIRHGLARALNAYNPDVYRAPLKYLGYLTRDARKVERKKIGHKKARKKPQWVRR